MDTFTAICKLLDYAEDRGLIEHEERRWALNTILDVLKLSAVEAMSGNSAEEAKSCNSAVEAKSSNSAVEAKSSNSAEKAGNSNNAEEAIAKIVQDNGELAEFDPNK